MVLTLLRVENSLPKTKSLERFIKAQDQTYELALAEIKQGKKRSHWMWYIFPQLKGLGFSDMSQYYGITDISEANAYLKHVILGTRLIQISEELLKLPTTDACQIFGSPDELKLRSSMTLFALIKDADKVFEKVLTKFFDGKKDPKTLSFTNKVY